MYLLKATHRWNNEGLFPSNDSFVPVSTDETNEWMWTSCDR